MDGVATNFREFMFASSMAETSAAFAIGSASAALSKTITDSVLLPLIHAAWRLATPELRPLDVLEGLLNWFCVIFVAYFLSEVFFSQGLLGIKTTLNDEDKKQLHVAKERADEDKSKIVTAAEKLISDPMGYGGRRAGALRGAHTLQGAPIVRAPGGGLKG